MCTKVPKDKSMVAVNVRQLYIVKLTECPPTVKTFIEAKQLPEQAASIKKITSELKEAESNESVLDVLVDTYLQCGPKHPIKRALASCLQSVSTVHPCVQPVLTRHLTQCLQDPGPLLPNCRTMVDNCNSLLENFPLGEQCLQCLLFESLSFLCESLNGFYDEARKVNTPVALSEAMHNCHVTVQVWNKLLARSEKQFSVKPEKVDENLSGVVSKCLNIAWEILLDGTFLVDCRASCGMTIPLIFKVMHEEDIVQKVVNELFPASEAAVLNHRAVAKSQENLTNRAPLSDLGTPSWSTTMVCLAGGCLAMLDATHLAEVTVAGRSLLCGVIGNQLIDLIEKMDEINGKVLLSRTLVLWTVQAIETFDEIQNESVCLGKELHGNSEMLTALMQYAWTHWEDSTQVIRHQARMIFNNILKCHLMVTGEEPYESKFLLDLLASLLSTGWQHRGRYGPLCCLVGHLGAGVVLKHTPNLPQHLLTAIGDQTLAGYISELYEKLYSAHRRELSLLDGNNMASWLDTWVKPVLDTLCDGTKHQKTHAMEYILPKLLKHSPDSLPYMTMKLSEGERVESKVSALMTCLKRAKMSGLLQPVGEGGPESGSDSYLWYGVVSVDIIKKSLCHQNTQLRLDVLGLVVEHAKTTELLSSVDLQLIVFFLQHGTMSQEPSFRQHLAAILKKLFVRLRDGAQCLQRKVNAGHEETSKDVEQYQEFVQWFVKQQFSSLYPSASFPCRTMALSALSMFTSVMAEKATTNHKVACEFALSNYITACQAQTLIECLSDPFELNKIDSYKILSSLPHDKLYLQSPKRLEALFRTGLLLASSSRPQDSSTAAYLLRVLLTQPHLQHVASLVGQLEASPQQLETDSVSVRQLAVIEVLVKQLDRQLGVAQKSLIHAAATEPMYPTLHCIRYLLNDVDLRSEATSSQWHLLIKSIVDISLKIADVVSPIVSNSSPEGNVPIDQKGIIGPGLELIAISPSPQDAAVLHGTENSFKTVNLMPEYLVVCCWRSIKECSLLLGQLTLTAPLTDPSRDADTGLLSVAQLHVLGNYFTTQLLESRHRGAFELAYAGFVKMTEMLWKCPFTDVQALPTKWLELILSDIKSREPTNRLCSTRRSAGVPFYVQAIVSAEPIATGRACFKHLMTELLMLAVPTTVKPTTEDPAQVHALNILRALYRDTRLGEDVFPYVTGGVKAAILGYGSQLWGIRNSATLLFSALMTRIFGVKCSKDEISKKNCLTGQVFFHRFPGLYQFLLDQMASGTSNIGSGGVYELHPGLYPVLMVLARLYPSVVEGSKTTLNTSAFVPYVIRCASSPVYKTRLMAASAIQPLVAKHAVIGTLTSLLDCLPTIPEDATSQNMLHGVLLQVIELARTVGEFPSQQVDNLLVMLTTALQTKLWMLTVSNPCLVTRKAFAELCFTVLALEDSLPDNFSRSSTLRSTICKQSLAEIFSADPPPAATPELTEYHQTLTRHLLAEVVSAMGEITREPTAGQTNGHRTQVDETFETMPVDKTVSVSKRTDVLSDQTQSKSFNGENLHGEYDLPIGQVELVLKLLVSVEYEVRLEVLTFLSNIMVDSGSINGIKCQGKKDDSIVKILGASERLYRQLVTMAFTEQHTDCLIMTLELLCSHSMIHTLPWTDNKGTAHTALTVMAALEVHGTHFSDDVRCCVHELSACLIPHLYSMTAQGSTTARGVLLRWCGKLQRRCSSQETVSCRQTTASSLLQGGRMLLQDPRDLLGPVVYDVWTAVIRLLQDEHIDVRHIAAKIVHDVSSTSDDIDKTDRECFAPQPVVALECAIGHLVALRSDRDWRGLFDCLMSWLVRDVEPEWEGQEEKAVRLFDKGEMNTYRDEMVFLTLVAEQMTAFLQHSVNDNRTESANGENSQDASSYYYIPNARVVVVKLRLGLVKEKLDELLISLNTIVSSMDEITGSTPFLMASHYQEDMLCLRRLKMACDCLLGVVDEKDKYEHCLETFTSDLEKKFILAEAQQNVLISVIL